MLLVQRLNHVVLEHDPQPLRQLLKEVLPLVEIGGWGARRRDIGLIKHFLAYPVQCLLLYSLFFIHTLLLGVAHLGILSEAHVSSQCIHITGNRLVRESAPCHVRILQQIFSVGQAESILGLSFLLLDARVELLQFLVQRFIQVQPTRRIA